MKTLNKYLFEVIAIFIGITLSFVFEEWRENRQEHKEEILIYKSLLNDVEIDQDRVARIGRDTEGALSNINKTFDLIKAQTPIETEVLFNEVMSFYRHKERNQSLLISFESVKSSGNLKLVRDENILRLIYSIKGNQQIFNEMIEVERNNASKVYEQIIMDYPGLISAQTRFWNSQDLQVQSETILSFLNNPTINDRLTGLRHNSSAIAAKAKELNKDFEKLNSQLLILTSNSH